MIFQTTDCSINWDAIASFAYYVDEGGSESLGHSIQSTGINVVALQVDITFSEPT